MNRIDRLTAILIQLQSKRIVKAKELAQRFGISIRTVYRDIRSLEAAGIPIGSDAGKGYYLAEGYHLPPVMFTTEEAGALFMAGKLMDKFSDSSLKEQFESALYKIKAVLRDGDKDYLDALQNKIEVYRTAEEKTASKSHFLAEIQGALWKKNILLIEYCSPKDPKPTFRRIEPIALGFYESRWHLIAYCRLRRNFRDFRVDRIKSLSVEGEVFNRKDYGSIEEILKEMLVDMHLHKVTVRFDKNTPYDIIKNKCFYGFVAEKELESKVEMTLLVDSLPVFGKWLLDYGTSVEIIDSPQLKAVMRQYAKAIAEQYLD